MAKLLLVEDDNNLREIYEARLTAEGYDISTAQNGEEALSIAKQLRPDLIISDVMMPRISGFEMLDILRNTDELKSTKVIMLTALGQAEDRGRADNLGADKYLVKSQVTLEDIVQAAHELLEGGEEATAVEPAAAPAPAAATPVSEPAPQPEPLATPAPTASPEVVAAPVEPVDSIAIPPTPVQITPEPVVAAPIEPTQIAQAAEPSITPVAPPVDQPIIEPSLVVPAPEPVVAAPTQSAVSTPTDDYSNSNDVSSVAPAPIQDTDGDLVLPQAAQATPPAAPSAVPVMSAPPVVAAPPVPAEQPVTPEETANDAVLEAAINNLTTEPTQEAPAVESTPTVVAPPTEQPTQPINPSEPTGRKVISPITDPNEGPDINALLAQEEAKESSETTVATPPAPTTITPSVPTPSVQAPTSEPMNGVDPNSIAL